MSQSIKIQEFAIAIAAKKHNPTIVTPDFLKYSGVVPGDWELARQPIVTNSAAQVIFQNGVSVTAEVNRIIFSEVVIGKEPKEAEIAAIAQKYVEKLPQVNYQAVGINFRGHVPFDQQENTARKYILGTLLNSGPWQEYGQAPVQAAIRFVYNIEGVQLNLDINEAGLQLPDQTVQPIVLFTANFAHTLTQENQNGLLTELGQVIGNWQKDLEHYQEVVNTKFLGSGSYQINFAPSDFIIPATPIN